MSYTWSRKFDTKMFTFFLKILRAKPNKIQLTAVLHACKCQKCLSHFSFSFPLKVGVFLFLFFLPRPVSPVPSSYLSHPFSNNLYYLFFPSVPEIFFVCFTFMKPSAEKKLT